jgi:hypothetical protein
VTDDRYTVDDPPEHMARVFLAYGGGCVLFSYHEEHDAHLVAKKIVHRTPESAEAHARRMVMADEILEALEAMVLAIDRPGTAQNLAVLGANRVIARARGEVEG